MSHMRRALPLLALGLFLAPAVAHAGPKVKRKGGQGDIAAGATFCVSGQSDCTKTGSLASGSTGPMLGLNANLGYRFNKWFFLGAGYAAGWFNPDFKEGGTDLYKSGWQQGVFAVPRFILPIWRFDFGLEPGLGFSRQAFRVADGSPLQYDKEYTQGFAFRPGLTADIFVGRQVFLGARVDITLNAHSKHCIEDSSSVSCDKFQSNDVAGVHQGFVGLHFGGVF